MITGTRLDYWFILHASFILMAFSIVVVIVVLKFMLCCVDIRMVKRKRKSHLQPCSSKKVEPVTIGDEKLSNTELDSMHEMTRDEGVEEVNLCGIPLHNVSKINSGAGVTFVLEKASLTLAYVGKRYQILSSDEHADYMRKKNLNPYNYRPDIVHEALLQIMDSRLRMAGKLKAVYIRTDEGILIKVEPYAQIPRTLGSFCNMMAELQQRLCIKAKGKGKTLLRVVANPVTKYLSSTSRKIGLSFSSQNAVQLREYVSGIDSEEEVVFAVGVMAHGKIESDYIEDLVSVSPFHLSSGVCLRHICIAMERKLNIH